MFIEANKNPKKDELGSKSINSLTLQKINEDNKGSLYFTPQQISIPMGIPIKFGALEDKQYTKAKALFDKVDGCNPSDL